MRPDIYPYREYVQRTNYGKDWTSHVGLFLRINNLTLEEYKNQIIEKFYAAGSPEECLHDILTVKNMQDPFTKDEAFAITMLDFWLDK